jgi:hypothetical protein
MPRTPKLITIRDLAKRLNKDVSFIRKTAEELKLKMPQVQRKKDGKIVGAITLKDCARLLKAKATLDSKPIGKSDVSLTDVADAIKVDISYALRLIKKHNLNLYYRKAKGTRSVNCISFSSLSVLKKKTGRPFRQA